MRLVLLATAGCVGPLRAPIAPPPPSPPEISLHVVPADARVTVNGEAAAGAVVVPVGKVSVHAERAGYEPLDVDVDVAAGEHRGVDLALVALHFPASIRLDPPGHLALQRDGARIDADGAGWTGDLLGGTWTITASSPGRTDEVATIDVTAPVDRQIWLELPGQLLDLVSVFPTGREPKAVLVVGDELWVTALDGPPSVIVHDLATGAIEDSITLGEHGAVELAVNAANTRVYASQMETARVFEIDRESRQVLRELRTRSNWTKVLALSADERTLYASNWNFDDVSAIDLATGDATRIPTVHTPRGLFATADGRWLYVAGFGGGQLAKIDLQRKTSRVVWSGGGALRELAGDAHTLYASDMHAAKIWAIDLATDAVRPLASTDRNPNTVDLSPDGQVLFVSNRGPNGGGGYLTVSATPGSVLAIDTATGAVLDAVVAGHQTTGLDVSPDGTLLVASDFRDDAIRVWRVPPTAALRAGAGGRASFHAADLRAAGTR